MINTHHTSLAPPPLPPRQHHSQPILIPAPLPSPGRSKYIIRFLVGIVLLHLFLSVGAFIYLYQNEKMKNPNFNQAGGKAYQSMENQKTYRNTLARMVVRHPHTPSQTGYLQWDMNHSILSGVNYYNSSWLTVLQRGNYYVYSRVTFSKGDPKARPLASMVKLRTDAKEEETVVMQAFCYLDVEKVPHWCTASQGEVLMLEVGNQLSVWVQDLSLVNYQEGANSFGMYKL